jgi:hypothetical protein
MIILLKTKTRKIKDSMGKTYQETRLNADGAPMRPILIARSSQVAPIRAIPSSAAKQEERTNTSAPATRPTP